VTGAAISVTTNDASEYNWSGFFCPYCNAPSFVSCGGGHLSCDGTVEIRNGRPFRQCFCGHAAFISGNIKTFESERLSMEAEVDPPNVPPAVRERQSSKSADTINPAATPLWPPTGFALALVLLRGYRIWPAILVGSLSSHLMDGRSGVWDGLSFVFPCDALECSAIHLPASCSVRKPLIASVSPSGHRISIAQPVPGFFRAKKVGRSSNILRICACGGPLQDSYPATIKLTA
jgi:MASE1 protein